MFFLEIGCVEHRVGRAQLTPLVASGAMPGSYGAVPMEGYQDDAAVLNTFEFQGNSAPAVGHPVNGLPSQSEVHAFFRENEQQQQRTTESLVLDHLAFGASVHQSFFGNVVDDVGVSETHSSTLPSYPDTSDGLGEVREHRSFSTPPVPSPTDTSYDDMEVWQTSTALGTTQPQPGILSMDAILGPNAFAMTTQQHVNSRAMEVQPGLSEVHEHCSGMEVDLLSSLQASSAMAISPHQNSSAAGPPSKKPRSRSSTQSSPGTPGPSGPSSKRIPKTLPDERPKDAMVIGPGLLTSTQFFKTFLALVMCEDPSNRARLKQHVVLLEAAVDFVEFAMRLNEYIDSRREQWPCPKDTQMTKIRLFVRSYAGMRPASLNDMLLGFKGYESSGAIKGTPFHEVQPDNTVLHHVTHYPHYTHCVKPTLLLSLDTFALAVKGTAEWAEKNDGNAALADALEEFFTPCFYEEFLSQWCEPLDELDGERPDSGVACAEETSDDVMSDTRDASATSTGGAHAQQQSSPHSRLVAVRLDGKRGDVITVIHPRYLGNPQQFLPQYLPRWAQRTFPGTPHHMYTVKLFVAEITYNADGSVDIVAVGENLAHTRHPLGDHDFVIVLEKRNPPLEGHKDGLLAGKAGSPPNKGPAPSHGGGGRARGFGRDPQPPVQQTHKSTHRTRQQGSSEDSSSPQESGSVNSDCSDGELILPLPESIGKRTCLPEGTLGPAVQFARTAVLNTKAEIVWSLQSPPKVTLVVRMDPVTIPRLFLHLSCPAQSVSTMQHFDFARQRVEGETFLESVCCDLFARRLEVVGYPWRVQLGDLHINHPPILWHKVTLENDHWHFCTATDADGKPRHPWDYVRKGSIERMRLGWRCGNNRAHTCLGVERCPTDQFEIYAATQSDSPVTGLCFECGTADAPARVQVIASFECCGCEATSDVDGCIALMPPLVSVKKGQLSARSGAPITDPYALQFEPCRCVISVNEYSRLIKRQLGSPQPPFMVSPITGHYVSICPCNATARCSVSSLHDRQTVRLVAEKVFEKVAGMDPQNTSGPLHNERAAAAKRPSRPLSYTDRESGPRHEKVKNLISQPATSHRAEDDSVGAAPDSKKALYTHVAKAMRHAVCQVCPSPTCNEVGAPTGTQTKVKCGACKIAFCNFCSSPTVPLAGYNGGVCGKKCPRNLQGACLQDGTTLSSDHESAIHEFCKQRALRLLRPLYDRDPKEFKKLYRHNKNLFRLSDGDHGGADQPLVTLAEVSSHQLSTVTP
eukprot:m.407281 g.407281  ORF g.407281 m.407281 type:complete len:1256 (+) comp16797_c0_seq18:1203-4970(+)